MQGGHIPIMALSFNRPMPCYSISDGSTGNESKYIIYTMYSRSVNQVPYCRRNHSAHAPSIARGVLRSATSTHVAVLGSKAMQCSVGSMSGGR